MICLAAAGYTFEYQSIYVSMYMGDMAYKTLYIADMYEPSSAAVVGKAVF